ncbi:outer membrane protein [Halonatronum saccharophilum]|uniref:outer membrane protein n=1 Tax=Halonatronum saccharophilum TaxID=150060 RepID=UPI000488C9B9|nr:S-layer homology domain-containing protein [Halonatronum saccharophilum]
MKKNLTLVLALALVFTMTMPVMANPFNDVPANHWAHDALEQVATAGLLEGYGDGTYRGEESLSRYQVAVLTSRVVEKVENENSELSQEVIEVINQLAAEFDNELAAIDSRLAGLEVVTISGETGVEYSNVTVGGNEEVAYENPFDIDEDEVISAEEFFKHFAEFDVNIEKDGVIADLSLAGVANYFGSEEEGTNFELDSISGSVTTEDFVATIGDEQDLDWKDYLFADEDNIDGIILNAGNSTVAVGRDEEDVTSVGAKQEGLFNLPLNAFLGAEWAEEGRNVIAGMDTEFNMMDIDFTSEFAASDSNLNGRLFKLGGQRDLGIFRLAGNYENTANFVGIQVDEDFEADRKGYDLSAATDISKVEVGVTYESYDDVDEVILAAEVSDENPYTIFGVDVFGNYEYEVNSKNEVRYVEGNKELGNLNLAAIYDFDSSDDLDDKVLSAAYATELNFAGIQFTPEAKVATIFDGDNNRALNTEAGIGALYVVNDRLSLNAGYNFADMEARVDQAGRNTTANAGLEYKVTDSSAATLNLERTDFTGADEETSFDTQSITGGFSINF